MKTVVFIETNFTGIDAIVSSAKAGIKSYLVTSDLPLLKRLLPEELFAGLEANATVINVRRSDDISEVIDTLKNIPHKIDAVMTFSQFRLVAAAQIAEKLGLRASNTESLEVVLNKYRLREVMSKAGLPSIRYMEFDAKTTSGEVVREIGLPCIFKPSRGHSSLGVKLAKTQAELEKIIFELNKSHNQGSMIIEEYLEGPLFSLETITPSEGNHITWGYTDRELTSDFIEIGGSFPAHTPNDIAGIELIRNTLNTIGFNFGACHTELIFTKNGPRIVEINPRPGGSGVCRLIQLATGVDVALETVQMHLGISPSISLPFKGQATMKSPLPHMEGLIVRLPTRADILALKSVKDVWFQRKVGDQTDNSRSNFSWLLSFIASSSPEQSSQEAALAAEKYINTRVQIEELVEQSSLKLG